MNYKQKHLKCLVLGPGARRTFRLSSRTPRIPFYMLTQGHIYKSLLAVIVFLQLQQFILNYYNYFLTIDFFDGYIAVFNG